MGVLLLFRSKDIYRRVLGQLPLQCPLLHTAYSVSMLASLHNVPLVFHAREKVSFLFGGFFSEERSTNFSEHAFCSLCLSAVICGVEKRSVTSWRRLTAAIQRGCPGTQGTGRPGVSPPASSVEPYQEEQGNHNRHQLRLLTVWPFVTFFCLC